MYCIPGIFPCLPSTLNLYHANIILSSVNDCTKDMVTFTAKISMYTVPYSMEYYCMCMYVYVSLLWNALYQVDVIGPHYTSDGTLHHKFLLPTLMDAIFKLHKCGFETCVVVCDGASSNLTMIKELTGAERKAYRYALN